MIITFDFESERLIYLMFRLVDNISGQRHQAGCVRMLEPS